MPTIVPGEVVPNFRLPDQSQKETTLWRFKQRRPVVLVLWRDGDETLLTGFARHYPAYRRLGAEVLALGTAPPPPELPFPALRDKAGATAANLADQRPAILILDSYGELFTRVQGTAARAPDHNDLLEWVFFTQVQCEECGPHAENWPRR
ncbi:hypothetical protein [Thiohalorhabdus sp.]|uniref:hypothetical protein n=1 Tax=Thiohalorhabdus sp. TaxID=3094134 RepID=UPI002FC2FBB7